MTKVIAVHLLNDFSGSPKVLSQSIHALKCAGATVELYTAGGDDGFLSGVANKHQKFCYRRSNKKLVTLIYYLISQVSLFFKLLRHRNEGAVIYVNTLLPFGAAIAGKLMGKKVIYHVHETSISPPILKKFLRFIVRKSASKVVFVSHSLKKAESFKNIDQSVLYNALPNSFYKDAAAVSYQHLDGNGLFQVLMVCSLKAYKGVTEFVEVAQRCVCYKQVSFTLVLNAEDSEVREYFEGLHVPENLCLVSRQSNLIGYYTRASLVMNLSRVDQWVETFGLTILEAMAFGIPVIAPPIGGPAEIIENGINGYLISSYDVSAITKKIIGLAESPRCCLEVSKAARARVEFFKQENYDKKILEVLLG